MYRYFVVIWNAQDLAQARSAEGFVNRLQRSLRQWTQVIAVPGVVAFHAGLDSGASRTWALHDVAGAVFGRLFKRDSMDPSAAECPALNASESLRIVRSGGQYLLRGYWGRYVALGLDAISGEAWVMRDPTGGLPCLLARHEGVHLVFSDTEDCCELGLLRFSVRWSYIRQLLAYSALQVRDTALEEVSEVQPGERVCFGTHGLRRHLEWHPFALAAEEPLRSPVLAERELRRTVRGCVQAWARHYPTLIHGLSGGLDSSIVLSCLQDMPGRPEITCLHYFGGGPEEDERVHARSVAAHAKVRLIEQPLDPHAIQLSMLHRLRPSARPWFYLYELEHAEFEAHLADELGAAGWFAGGGGDGVFYQARGDLAVIDYLLDRGVSSGLLAVAGDAARVSQHSIWWLLWRALRARLLPSRQAPFDRSRSFVPTLLSGEVLKERYAAQMAHPWFETDDARRAPPGNRWHALTIGVPPAFYGSFASQTERTMPLLSQPIVELSLRIPTYVLIQGGIDRAVARRAFSADIPASIARRRSKGRVDRHVRTILDVNLDLVRSILLDGRLAAEGLLKRKELESCLRPGSATVDFHYSQILQLYVGIEAWLARWQS